ncbi:uncharacterized protein LOC129593450 [Paramacrobiotus metropolitanus]|uniref:uncharacterized protein LOC129593450 n=1 Tax=Paramacrobiotus metropolitanus TaxID=2943436 RepID=UPI0024461BB2|nr:uncharacterized protein LOC129593450 [Paramacrobiotus metropolitanus]
MNKLILVATVVACIAISHAHADALKAAGVSSEHRGASTIPKGTIVGSVSASGGKAPFTYKITTGEKLVELFPDMMNPGGQMILAKSEMIAAASNKVAVTITDSEGKTDTVQLNIPPPAVSTVPNKPQ